MEYWQNRAKVKVAEVDFRKESHKIRNAFYKLCEPLLETQEIEFNKNENILFIGESKYSLYINLDGFGVKTSGKDISYNVDEYKMCYYYDSICSRTISKDRIPLESLDFNYIAILNIIMNEVID